MMIVKAVVDRIEDGKKAVILVGENQIEHIIDINQLPGGTSEGDLLQVQIDGDKIINIELDIEETENTKTRIIEKMKKIQKNTNFKI
ncbi:MAG: DUF3006 domain-containing protein [Vulcanibacillus sp.]